VKRNPCLSEAFIQKPPRASRKNVRHSHAAVIRVYDAAGNVIETHQHKGDFKEW